MLHAVKRKVARAQQPIKTQPNAEFADMKQRLQSIKQALKYTSNMLNTANRNWIIQMQAQRTFSERFYESYPTTHDELYVVSKEFAQGSQNLYDKFTRETSDDMTAYHNIHKQVLLYIREIETVESSYSKLTAAKSEASRYQSKLDAMERSRRQTDESKKARNLQKMDNEKDEYRKLLNSTIEAQKKTYAKHPIVFKAALTSYWLSHEKHVTLLVQSLEKTQEFAKKAENEMKGLDITEFVMPEELSPLPSPRKIPTDAPLMPETKAPFSNDTEEFNDAASVPSDVSKVANVTALAPNSNSIATSEQESEAMATADEPQQDLPKNEVIAA